MVSHSLAIGYHGCDADLARQIVSGDSDLKPSQNAWDWLGHGIYFWEGSHARALRWAETESGRTESKIKKPAVLGSVIDLGNCLKLYPAAGFRELDHIQICVRSPGQIIGYFLPRGNS